MKINYTEVLNYYRINGSAATVRKYENKILRQNDLSIVCAFAKDIPGANIEELESKILSSNDLKYICFFAQNIVGANIEACAKVVLESKNDLYNYLFAKDVKGADIKKHEAVILQNKNLEYNYLFAMYVKGADINKHAELILESKSLEYNYLFARHIENCDVEKHGKIIIDSENIDYNKLFIKNVKKANVSKHYEVLSRKQNKSVQENLSLSKTLAIIKPDGIKNIDKIIDMIYKANLKIIEYKVENLTKEILKEHYSHLLDKPFYPTLEEYMLSGSVVIMVLEGYDAVERFRDLMGPTDSSKAAKGTIRGEFGTNITYNAVHGSDSEESAEVEINRFFKDKQKIKK